PPRTPQAPTPRHLTTPPIPASFLPTDKAPLALMGNPHVVRPVALLDQALEQLARFRARHVGHEVDAARALDVRDLLPAESDQLGGQRIAGRVGIDQLHHRLDLLAE